MSILLNNNRDDGQQGVFWNTSYSFCLQNYGEYMFRLRKYADEDQSGKTADQSDEFSAGQGLAKDRYGENGTGHHRGTVYQREEQLTRQKSGKTEIQEVHREDADTGNEGYDDEPLIKVRLFHLTFGSEVRKSHGEDERCCQ